jgi:hypothetical protein
MYAEQASGHSADANFYFFKGYIVFAHAPQALR